MKNTLFLLVLGLLISNTGHAQNLIACMKVYPSSWYDIMGGKKSATISGPGLIIDTTANYVVWVATGNYLTVDAIQTQKGLAISKLSGSNPLRETIVKFETDKTSFSQVHTIKLKDSLGGFGYLTVSLQKVSSQKYMTGSASWSDQTGSKENLKYCTTLVQP